MKSYITITSILMLSLSASYVSAQDNVLVSRSTACSINPGYTMADVVETARNFEWPDESAPGFVAFREGIAVGGNNPEIDFIAEFSYPSYADMLEKRGAFLRSRAGRPGRRGLDGVATCDDNVWISNVRYTRPASQFGAGPIAPVAPVAQTLCELNGATVADAVALAETFRENVGARGAGVASRIFGGPRRPNNSAVVMRFLFQSFPDFGSGMDQFNQNSAGPNQETPISCSTGRLRRSYRIHSRNN